MRVMRDGRPVTVEVTADGAGLVSHAGSALLAQAADKLGLTKALSLRLAAIKQRRRGHDPGRVIRDLAVMLADGGECVSRSRGGARSGGAVRAGRVGLDRVSGDRPDRRRPGAAGRAARGARAGARAVLGAARRARAVDDRRRRDADHRALREGAGGRELQGRLRVSPAAGLRRRDARGARRVCCGRGTPARTPPPTTSRCSTARSSRSRPSAIEQIEILVRADSAGATHGLVDYCREANLRFSVGYELTEPVRAAILEIPADAWVPALEQDGSRARERRGRGDHRQRRAVLLAAGLAGDRAA